MLDEERADVVEYEGLVRWSEQVDNREKKYLGPEKTYYRQKDELNLCEILNVLHILHVVEITDLHSLFKAFDVLCRVLFFDFLQGFLFSRLNLGFDEF